MLSLMMQNAEILSRWQALPEAIRQGASVQEWQDASWQLRHSFTTAAHLESVLHLSPDEREALALANKRLSVRITPYFLSLMDVQDAQDPLRLQMVPRCAELQVSPEEELDPLHEQKHMVVPGLLHRYPDRVLILVSKTCASYCRYCTRARLVSGAGAAARPSAKGSQPDWEAIFAYLEEHSEVRDVLLSGGDPLLLSDKKLRDILSRLQAIKHIEFLRIGTRVPLVLPQRVTPDLCAMLREFSPLFLSIHCNHARELAPEAQQALGRLVDAGLPLGSQTVLLKGVNDNLEVQRALYHALLRCRVRPYYLYQCDLMAGSSHFRTPVALGIALMEELRGFTSGYAVPQFVLDAPHGGGKIHLNPQNLISIQNGLCELRNYEGKSFFYPAE